MRISKVLSQCGVSSRRDAEKLIENGSVSVNGVITLTPLTFIDAKDVIAVDGKTINRDVQIKLWKFFKPKGVITSTKDELGRTTLFELVPKNIGRVISVGRLDYNTEGLILLTNNGDLARALEHPSSNIKRRYLCRAYGEMPQYMAQDLSHGIEIDGIRYAPIELKINKTQGGNTWCEIILQEGKNREIRKIFEHFGLKVNRLIRIAYAQFNAQGMTDGDLSEISEKDTQLYIKLIKNESK